MKLFCVIIASACILSCCSNNNFSADIEKIRNEDYYLGMPGSKLFYKTTTKETQEKYHYAECHKKFPGSHKLKLESCVSSYWMKAKKL
tara:strand:- start:1147 stop:1410 length:264 start_codon:yes stop_codon:yes gene_type:complete